MSEISQQIIEYHKEIIELERKREEGLKEFIKNDQKIKEIMEKILNEELIDLKNRQEEWENESFMSIQESEEKEKLRKERKKEKQKQISQLKYRRAKKQNELERLREHNEKMDDFEKRIIRMGVRREIMLEKQIRIIQERIEELYEQISNIYI